MLGRRGSAKSLIPDLHLRGQICQKFTILYIQGRLI